MALFPFATLIAMPAIPLRLTRCPLLFHHASRLPIPSRHNMPAKIPEMRFFSLAICYSAMTKSRRHAAVVQLSQGDCPAPRLPDGPSCHMRRASAAGHIVRGAAR